MPSGFLETLGTSGSSSSLLVSGSGAGADGVPGGVTMSGRVLEGELGVGVGATVL